MATVLESYMCAVKFNQEGNVMGVIRTLFSDMDIDTYIKNLDKEKKNAVQNRD